VICVATIFKADPFGPGRGNLYRKEILLPGGSRDEMDSLKASFLFLIRVVNDWLIDFFCTVEIPWTST